ncbi:MAG: M15 family metallopeptidase [Pseudomonadota bacterium]
MNRHQPWLVITLVAVLLVCSPMADARERQCDAEPLGEPGPDYRRRVERLHRELGIPRDYGEQAGLELQPENRQGVTGWIDEGQGVFYMSREARSAWYRMNAAAIMDGVVLTLVSAYRPLERQTMIVRERLEQGQAIEDILETSAAPGYSEHHTGDAIDLNTTDTEAFSRDFAQTEAYEWLKNNASRFCFELSYPEDNGKTVRFEPWHWRFQRGD